MQIILDAMKLMRLTSIHFDYLNTNIDLYFKLLWTPRNLTIQNNVVHS